MKLKKTLYHGKHITTQKFKKITAENFAVRSAQAKSASKNNVDNFIERTDFDDKLKNINKKKLLQIKQDIQRLTKN